MSVSASMRRSGSLAHRTAVLVAACSVCTLVRFARTNPVRVYRYLPMISVTNAAHGRCSMRTASGLAGALAVLAVVTACGKSDSPITQAETHDVAKPGVIAIKDTVEEAYVYAFPMLMNYAVMLEYFVNL